MPVHLVAFDESEDSATLSNVTPIADQLVRTQGDDLFVPRDLPNIVGIYALGVNITRCQIISPSIRRLWNYEVAGLDRSAEPSSPQVFHDLRFNPLTVAPGEQLNVQAAEDGAGATRRIVLLWLADAPIQPIEGPVFTIRATGTTTLVADAWTAVALTMDQTLPAGEYEIVGMRVESAGCIAARLVFPGRGEQGWRPGVSGTDSIADLATPQFRRGQFGSFGRFVYDVPPQVEFLSVSADTAETVYLDLVPTTIR